MKIPELKIDGEITKLQSTKTRTTKGEKHVGKLVIESGAGHKVTIQSGPEILKGRKEGQDVEMTIKWPQTTLDDHTK